MDWDSREMLKDESEIRLSARLPDNFFFLADHFLFFGDPINFDGVSLGDIFAF